MTTKKMLRQIIPADFEVRPLTQDQRVDVGYWEGGLWADSGSGTTMAEAQASAIAPYLEDLEGDEPS